MKKNYKTFLNISIKNEEEEDKKIAVINIDGVIGEDWFKPEDEQNTTKNIRKKLDEISEIDADEIKVNINSFGGSVSDGIAIHGLLKENPAHVKTRIQGMCASSATVIFQAGDERVMSSNDMMLIHRAWTMTIGNKINFEAEAKDLEKIDGVISNIYSKRGTESQEFYLDLMDENTGDGRWLDASEALEFGLVDRIIEEENETLAMSKSDFLNMGLPVPDKFKDEQVEESEEVSDDKVSNEKIDDKEEKNILSKQENDIVNSDDQKDHSNQEIIDQISTRERLIYIFKHK